MGRYISGSLEKHVDFTNFCIDNNVTPRPVAEAIQAFRDASRNHSPFAAEKAKNYGIHVLKGMGFSNIQFEGQSEYPTFYNRQGRKLSLPKLWT